MDQPAEIKFLGTAGARFAMARQLRSSAGVFIQCNNKKIILDPGPGTLVKLAHSRPRIDVNALDAIILTHAHIDHSNDVNVLIDGMTDGGLHKKGALFAPRECLEGENAVVLKYLRGFLEEIQILQEKQAYSVPGISFSTSCRHLHGVETYGIIFDMSGSKVSFMVDTKFFPELLDSYKDSDILIINVVLRQSHERIYHLSIEDVRELLGQLKPRKAILTHFGMPVLEGKPWELAAQLTRDLGITVVAANDGMTVCLD